MVLHCWAPGWVGSWGDVRDADHGGIYGITHRRALCMHRAEGGGEQIGEA